MGMFALTPVIEEAPILRCIVLGIPGTLVPVAGACKAPTERGAESTLGGGPPKSMEDIQ